MIDTAAITLALRAPVLTLDSLPDVVSWENRRSKPAVGAASLREACVPATHAFTGHGSLGGYSTVDGLYVLTWTDLADHGLLTLAARADAVVALYLPGTSLVAPDGPVVAIRKNPAPWRGQVMPLEPGRAVVTITIPWSATLRVPAAAA